MLNLLNKNKSYISLAVLAIFSLFGNCVCTSKSAASSLLSIYPDRVTYKDGNSEEIEIKGWNEKTQQMDKSILLSRETMRILLSGTKVKTLKINNIIRNNFLTFFKSEEENNIKTYDFENSLFATLFTEENTGFMAEEDTIVRINTPQENSILAMTGINSMYVIFANCGETIVNTEYILLFANRIFREKNNAFLFANHYDSTLTLSYRLIAIENIIVESLEEGADLFGNFGTMTLGSQITEISVFSEIIIRGKKASQLFFNKDMCTLIVNSKTVITRNVDIKVSEEPAYLINNNEIINFGSQIIEELNFDNIKVVSDNENAYFIYNSYNSVLTQNGKVITVKNIKIESQKQTAYLVYNQDTVYSHKPKTAITFGSEITENLIFEEVNVDGHDYSYLLYNLSETIFNGKHIIMRNINIKSLEKVSFLIRNFKTVTFGSKITEGIAITNINIDSNDGTDYNCLIYNFFVLNFSAHSTMIVADNTVTPKFTFNGNNKYRYSVIFENIGEININVNSHFTLANNRMPKGSDGADIIDFLMTTLPNHINPQLTFTNIFGRETIIELETIISSFSKNREYYKGHNLINSILMFKGIGNNDNDDFTEIEEIIKPTKTSADIKEELFDSFPGMLFANAPIIIGSSTSNTVPTVSLNMNNNNNNDNYTFSYTNNDNNNNYDEDEEKEEENNRSKGSSLFKLPKVRVVEINKFVVGYTNIVVNLIRDAIGLKGVGDGSTLYITKGNKLIIELDEEYDDGNSHAVISGFNIPEEVKERIFLGPISKSKGFVGSFEGNDYIVYKNSGILKKAVEKVKECSIQ